MKSYHRLNPAAFLVDDSTAQYPDLGEVTSRHVAGFQVRQLSEAADQI